MTNPTLACDTEENKYYSQVLPQSFSHCSTSEQPNVLLSKKRKHRSNNVAFFPERNHKNPYLRV